MEKVYFVYFLVLISMGPVILASSPTDAQDGDCGTTTVDECYRYLQTFLRLTNLPFSTSKVDLDGFCSQSGQGYNCSTTLLTRSGCLSDKDRQLMPLFTHMAEYMHFMLCQVKDRDNNAGYLIDPFLSHSQCILDNRAKMECCKDGTKVSDLPVMRILEKSGKSLTAKEIQTCCPVSRYLQCTTAVITDNCGESAANFSAEYIRRAAGENVQFVCQKVPGYPEPDFNTCDDPAPTCSGSGAIPGSIRWFFYLSAFLLGVKALWKSALL